MQLEQVALVARRDGVASRAGVDGRRDESLRRDGDGHDAVVEHPAPVTLAQRHGIRTRRRGGLARDGATRGDPGPLEGRRVRLDHDVTLADERGERARHDGLGGLGDAGVLLDGLAVHPRDRGAGEDVVELLEEHLLPQRVELVVRGMPSPVLTVAVVAHSSASTSRCSVRRLPCLVGAATLACRGAARGRARRPRPAGAPAAPRPGRRRRRGAPSAPLASPRGRPGGCALPVISRVGAAATVAPAERGRASRWRRPCSRNWRSALASSTPESCGVVGVDRREVGEDPGAVDALPPEGVVGEHVDLVPGDLLGEEPARSRRRRDDLRQRGGVAEASRAATRSSALGCRARREEALAVARTGARATRRRRHVGVGLDPHAADRHEPARLPPPP